MMNTLLFLAGLILTPWPGAPWPQVPDELPAITHSTDCLDLTDWTDISQFGGSWTHLAGDCLGNQDTDNEYIRARHNDSLNTVNDWCSGRLVAAGTGRVDRVGCVFRASETLPGAFYNLEYTTDAKGIYFTYYTNVNSGAVGWARCDTEVVVATLNDGDYFGVLLHGVGDANTNVDIYDFGTTAPPAARSGWAAAAVNTYDCTPTEITTPGDGNGLGISAAQKINVPGRCGLLGRHNGAGVEVGPTIDNFQCGDQ